MNHLDFLLSSATVQALGWTLIHFIWQGALLALLLALVMGFLRTADARYGAGLGTLALMGIAPVITFFVQFEALSPTIAATISSQQFSIDPVVVPALAVSSQSALNWVNFDWLRVSVLLWFAGIIVLSLRTLGGWYVMERLRRRKAQLTGNLRVVCLQLQERMGIGRTVSYCQSYLTDAPSVIGWFRPVVLLPASALTGLTASQIEAIIAHELAHIRRLDAFVNLFQIAIETILFYHPGVWWVSRRVRMERENCCDDMAVSICGNPLEYAKALTLIETWRTAPALALAANGGSLKSRVSRLLGLQTLATGVPRIGVAAAALVLSAGVLLAGARFTGGLDQTCSFSGFGAKLDPPAAPAPPAVPEPYPEPEPAVPAAPVAPSAPAAPIIAQGTPEPPTPPAPPASPDSPAPPASPDSPAPAAPAAPPAPASPRTPAASGDHSSYIFGMTAAGYTNMSVDDLIAMKTQGITPEYVRDMRATGLNFSRSQLIGMKIQGVTPDYARRIRATWKNVSAHDLIEMRIQGVDPGDVSQFRQLGLGDLSRHKLIEMKIQGVTPDYIRQMKDSGFTGTAHEYLTAKVMGVTPEFVRMVGSHGFTDLSAHKLIELKVAGVF